MEFRKAHTLDEKDRTNDIKVEENIDFADMYLSEPVLAGLQSAGFIQPSPIQLSAIPLGRCGLDLVVQAKSGTGKTCVFTVIALEMISIASPSTQVLIIAPTREIAVQINQVIDTIAGSMPGLRTGTFIGGFSVLNDRAKLSCCHIAIGTPGRICQLIDLGLLMCENIRLLVLDEADQLLTGQFESTIMNIVSVLPLNKQVLAVSATYPEEIASSVERIMRSPSHVRLGKESPSLLGVNQFVKMVSYHPQPHRRHNKKKELLLNILSTVSFNQCLIFSNSQLRAESLCTFLKENKWPTTYLTGGLAQTERLKAFDALCSYKIRVLVSTDLSARGIDSEHVNLVINLDIPHDQSTYLHRVGRAGRFGSHGVAVSLACEGEEWDAMRAISTLANVKIIILKDDFKCLNEKLVKDMCYMDALQNEDLNLWICQKSCNKKTKSSIRKKEKKSEKSYESPMAFHESFSNKGTLEASLTKNVYNEDHTKINLKQGKDSFICDMIHLPGNAILPVSYTNILKECAARTSNIDLDIALPEILTDNYPANSNFKNLDNLLNNCHQDTLVDVKDRHKLVSPLKLLQKVIQNEDVTNKKMVSGDDILPKNALDSQMQHLSLVHCNTSKQTQSLIAIKDEYKESNCDHYCNSTGFGTWHTFSKTKENQNSINLAKLKRETTEAVIENTSTEQDPNGTSYRLHSNKKSKPHIPSKHLSLSNGSTKHEFSSTPFNSYCSSVDAYVKSAQKLASMMEYTQTMGRMSSVAARNHQLFLAQAYSKPTEKCRNKRK